ncbi:hypothetical protein LI328DRAFT_87048 [Trichoderma asperelloides]|nr:hypothetical protein LI328DRAFT_87048 [Trichoderma asperelloides]
MLHAHLHSSATNFPLYFFFSFDINFHVFSYLYGTQTIYRYVTWWHLSPQAKRPFRTFITGVYVYTAAHISPLLTTAMSPLPAMANKSTHRVVWKDI